ncbi:hypothetical protein PRUPE_1G065900 [Prunus persica]|uniref:Uncharacterized protein n=1 Tax=Prunus persica TaxID=3760 RepID=A0A251QTA3_PRUPE|nr:hypothetical protein PRUPE_1G065900 [Prunus persica]
MRLESSTSSEHGGAVLGRYCKCRKHVLIRTSWTYLNPERKLYVYGTQTIIPGLLRCIRIMEEELQLQRAEVKKIMFWFGSCLIVKIILGLSVLSKPITGTRNS